MDNKYLGPRDIFIAENMGLAKKMSERFRSKLWLYEGMADIEDIYQLACIGLVRAYDKFDPSICLKDDGTEVAFSTYAVPTILGEIMRFLRDFNTGCHIPRPIKDKIPAFLSAGLSIADSVDTISDKMQWSKKDTKEFIFAYNSRTLSPLDKSIEEDENSPMFFKDLIRDPGNMDDQIILKDFISTLNQNQRITYELYFCHGYSQREIAEKIGCTQVSVGRYKRQIESLAINYKEAM